VSVLQIASAAPPFDRPAIGMRGARLLGLAEAMGLLQTEHPIAHLDWEALITPVHQLVERGIGRDIAIELEATGDQEQLARLLDRLYEKLLESPSPETEARKLTDLLGTDSLADLVGVSVSSIRRYATGERSVPDAIAARLHHLAVITSYLSGGYNEFGIRRWFGRGRAQLQGRTPADLLRGDWDSESPDALSVLHLAEALNSSPGT
jgi:transcriptional regulator with XRE-family HTH domain